MLLSQYKWPLWSSLPTRISSVKYGTTYSVQCRHWGRWIHAQKRLIFFNMPCHNSRHPQRSRTSILLCSEQLNLMRRKNTYICAWCQRWFVTPLEKVGRDNNRTRNTFFYVEVGWWGETQFFFWIILWKGILSDAWKVEGTRVCGT